MVGTNIYPVYDESGNETYRDESDPMVAHNAKYPQFTSAGRADFIGGASINTRYQDLQIGSYDIASFNNVSEAAKK